MSTEYDTFDAFYEGSYRRIVRTVAFVCGSRDEAEDVVQEAFVRLYPRWAKVQARADPEAWVRRVAMNLVIDGARRRRVRRLHRETLSTKEPFTGDTYPSDQGFLFALGRLSLEQRKILVLRYVVDLSIDQIAENLNLSPGAVKSRLYRARLALQPVISEDVNHA